jgi:hypothetical protein
LAAIGWKAVETPAMLIMVIVMPLAAAHPMAISCSREFTP